MPQFPKPSCFAPLVLLLLVPVGCNESPAVDAKTLAAYRNRMTLAAEPDGVQTVADVRVALLGEAHDPHAGHDHADDEHDDQAGHDSDGDGHEEHVGGDDHDADGHDADGHDAGGHDAGDHAADGHAAHDEHGDPQVEDAGHDHADPAQYTGSGTEEIDVNMVGHIGGLANPWAEAQPEFPFSKTQAVLFLADPQGVIENEASGHSHAPGEECVYCAAHATDQANMLAMVQFVDKNGDVLPMDVRELFDVKEKDIVVVRGKARVTAGGILVVDAQGLYIRK